MWKIPECPHSNARGGMSTRFDPYRVRESLGLQTFPWKTWCWDCWKKHNLDEISKKLDREIVAAIQERNLCGFLESYRGYCMNDTPCPKHDAERCWKCKQPATSNCSVSGSLVCGAPQCDKHPHTEYHQEKALTRQIENRANSWGL